MRSTHKLVAAMAISAGWMFPVIAWSQPKPAPLPPKPQPLPDAVTPAMPTAEDIEADDESVGLPATQRTPQFGFPDGLKTPADELIPKLGFGPADCFPLTPITCFAVGYKCYSVGLYEDAVAFANEGLQLSNHARLYLLKAVCEMHLGHCDQATSAMVRYRNAATLPVESIGLYTARERINDPMRVRLEFLINALPPSRPAGSY